MSSCAICHTKYRGDFVKMIRVPKKPEKRKKWTESTGVQFTESARICEHHFQQTDFKVAIEGHTKRRCLMPDAIPSAMKVLAKMEYLSDDEHEHSFATNKCSTHRQRGTQTDSDTIAAGSELEVIRLKNMMRDLQTENARLKKQLIELNNLNETLPTMFTQSQIRKLKNLGKRVCWNSDDISYGISLHAAGPRAYNLLYDKGFPLPSLSTMQKWLQKSKIKTGVLDCVLEEMAKNDELWDEEKICVLLCDKVKVLTVHDNDTSSSSVKESYKYVQLVMARGLLNSWKQPIFFNFESRMNKSTLLEIITKLYEIGYRAVAFISNLNTSSQILWKELQISIHKTWFENPVNSNEKVFVFVDAPNLMKFIRNQFLDTGMLLHDRTITSETIKQVMGHTFTSEVTTKVTVDHLSLRFLGSQEVKLAIELFSNNTANALRHCYSLGLDVDNACETAAFIQLINDWFDLFNTELSSENNVMPSKQPYGTNLEFQRQILNDMNTLMGATIIPNSTKLAPFQKSIIVSNKSLNLLQDYLMEKYEIKYLHTRKLNQDILQEFFITMGANGAQRHPPSTLQFQFMLQKYLLDNKHLHECKKSYLIDNK